MKQREAISQERIRQITQRNHELQDEVINLKSSSQELLEKGEEMKSQNELIKKLREKIKQDNEHERLRQEEVARCRAQVVSLSAELTVERQMVDEARQQLAIARASQKHQLSSLTDHSSLTPVVSLHTATSDSFSDVEYPQLPPTRHKK